jgi:hypothetical protein
MCKILRQTREIFAMEHPFSDRPVFLIVSNKLFYQREPFGILRAWTTARPNGYGERRPHEVVYAVIYLCFHRLLCRFVGLSGIKPLCQKGEVTMLKRLTALLVLICFVTTGCATRHVSAHSQPAPSSANQSKEVTEIKKKAVNLGVGCKVSVRLFGGKKLKGQILEITDDYLVLQSVSDGTIRSQRLAFPTIMAIHKQGLSTGTQALIGVGVGAGIMLGLLLLVAASID